MSPRLPGCPARVSFLGLTCGTCFMASSLLTPFRYPKKADTAQPGQHGLHLTPRIPLALIKVLALNAYHHTVA